MEVIISQRNFYDFWFQSFSHTCVKLQCHTQPVNIGPQDVPRASPSNLPRTSPKDPIWPSRGCPNLTSWRRPEMTSRGRLNLKFKGRPWEVDSGRPQDVLRTSPRGPWEYWNLDVYIFLNFSFRTCSIDQM